MRRRRETATVAQLLLATTIDGDTHLSLATGWNGGASPEDIHVADRFTRLYFLYLEQLNVPLAWLTPQPGPAVRVCAFLPLQPFARSFRLPTVASGIPRCGCIFGFPLI